MAHCQMRKPAVTRQRTEFDARRITEHGRRDGTAHIDIEAGPQTLRAYLGESRQRSGRSADDVATCAHAFQGGNRDCRCCVVCAGKDGVRDHLGRHRLVLGRRRDHEHHRRQDGGVAKRETEILKHCAQNTCGGGRSSEPVRYGTNCLGLGQRPQRILALAPSGSSAVVGFHSGDGVGAKAPTPIHQCSIWLRKSLVRSCCGLEKNGSGSFSSMIWP
jgi:hypothetical protein